MSEPSEGVRVVGGSRGSEGVTVGSGRGITAGELNNLSECNVFYNYLLLLAS